MEQSVTKNSKYFCKECKGFYFLILKNKGTILIAKTIITLTIIIIIIIIIKLRGDSSRITGEH